jgi:hypothetical protein
MKRRLLSLCGMIAPVLFVFIAILGGAIRPGYSHISDTVSELFSPGSPNKPLLDTLYTTFAILLAFFGIGLLEFVQGNEKPSRAGIIGASAFIAMALLNVTTATVFPQDAWGSPPTFPGRMHVFIHGVISLLSLLYIILIGIWSNRAGLFPGFRTYSFITVGLAFLSAMFFAVNVGSPVMGLAERITILIGFQWTFTLALRIFLTQASALSR